MAVPLRDLPGRNLIQEIQRFEWRYRTLRDDYVDVLKVKSPPKHSVRKRQFSNRDHLYEAERRLHHYLSGYYSFYCLVTTIAEATTEPKCGGLIKHQRHKFADFSTTRTVLGLRHYIQHENILPLVIWQSEHSDRSPAYALNKEEIEMGEGYNEGFEYHYGNINGPVVFPFEIIYRNWPVVRVLRERIRHLLKTYHSSELLEYKQRLKEMQERWDEIAEEQGLPIWLRDMIESEQSIPTELRELVENTNK